MIILVGSNLLFIFGLGITQCAEDIALGIGVQTLGKTIVFISDCFVAAIAILFGLLSKKRFVWGVSVGIDFLHFRWFVSAIGHIISGVIRSCLPCIYTVLHDSKPPIFSRTQWPTPKASHCLFPVNNRVANR